MKKTQFRIIILLSAFAIIALICVQLYWITNAYQLRKENFNKKVQELLTDVTGSLEKYNGCIDIFSKAYIKPGERLILMRGSDQNGHEVHDTLGLYSIYVYNGDTMFTDFKNFDFRYPALAEVSLKYKMQFSDTIYAKSGYAQAPSFNNITLKNYKKVIKDDRSILSFISKEFIDSLLHQKLIENGIDEKYIYGIKSKSNHKFELISDNADQDRLNNTVHKVSFLEGQYFNNPHELMVYFPSQNAALLRSMMMLLVISVMIIAGLLVTFWYMTKTIHHQRELAKMKSDFINNMTHEFNTPLASISLAGQSLNDNRIKKDEASLKKLSYLINNESQRLFNHLDRILQLGVVENNPLELKKEIIDVHVLIEKLALLFEHKLPLGNMVLTLNAQKSRIEGDELHINSAFYNLMDNAIKYSNEVKYLEIMTYNQYGNVIIKIIDKGIGMKKEDLKKIFEKFTRLNNGDQHESKGFGIGLSYVKHVVAQHGGQIKVKSALHKGSCFELEFPAFQEEVYEKDFSG